MAKYQGKFVSRAGEKLSAALQAFDISPQDYICADFGCNVGGFTDCMLQQGARKVYAIDTGYGALAWKLRQDQRVVVMERTNALHTDPTELVDMVAIDVAWTPQALVIPSACKWVKPGGLIVSLLKPAFEYAKIHGKKPFKPFTDEESQQIVSHVTKSLSAEGYPASAVTVSPIRGKGGNLEFLLLVKPQNFAKF